jgi:hypothetical protein
MPTQMPARIANRPKRHNGAQLTAVPPHIQNADSARMRFLAKRVAGGAPITSLCAWLGLRLRGRNLRPSVKVHRDFPVGGQPISLWGGQVMSVPGGRLISRKRVAGDDVNPVGMGLFASIPQAPTTRATPRRRLPGGFIRGRYEALMPVP